MVSLCLLSFIAIRPWFFHLKANPGTHIGQKFLYKYRIAKEVLLKSTQILQVLEVTLRDQDRRRSTTCLRSLRLCSHTEIDNSPETNNTLIPTGDILAHLNTTAEYTPRFIITINMEYNSESNCSSGSLTGGSREDDARVFYSIIVNFIVLFVGVPGNCLIIRVYWAKTVKKSTYVLITSLAWADLFACTFGVSFIVCKFLKLACFETSSWCHFFRLLRTIIVTTSVMLTGVIAADRYDCVCRPQKRFFNLRRAKIASWASFVFATIGNLPLLLSLYFHNSVMIAYISNIVQIVCFLSSLLTIMFCYGKVYLVIRKHVRASPGLDGAKSASSPGPPNTDSSDEVRFSHRHHADELNTPRDGSSSQGPTPEQFQERPVDKSPTSHEKVDSKPVHTSSETGAYQGSYKSKLDLLRSRSISSHSVALQRKTTRMLFTTSLVFLLTWFPYWVWNALSLARLSGGSSFSPGLLVVMEDISLIFLLNSVVNPFIYGIANRRFRDDCRKELRKLKVC